MGNREWTPAQRQCIFATGGTLLVSAAAGSGKTSVLIERILQKITHPDTPVDIDRLLVVTFTKAAAAEMRQRLSRELSRLIAAHPENTRLQRQQLLLPSAAISTVDGYCTSLLREYFHLLDLSPQFRVAENTETAALSKEALEEVLEECYSEQNSAFLQLAALLSSSKSDQGLFEAVMRIYEFMQCHPFPEQWMREAAAMYTPAGDIRDTRWGQAIRQHILNELRTEAVILRKAWKMAMEEPKMAAAYGHVLQADREELLARCRALALANWDEAALLLAGNPFGRLGSLNKYQDEIRKQRVQKLRNGVKDDYKKLVSLLCGTEEQCQEDLRVTAPLVQALFDVVRRYTEAFARKKQARRLVDFHDLEHYALRLLVRAEESGILRRTSLAQELSERYEEVMVDEYQDTNATQDALFCALSKDESNLFLVGDVKQSIYGFRQAMPEIFLRKRDAFPPYDGVHTPATITLGHNFRSRVQVTDAVNFVFRQLMTKETAGLDYDENEALVAGAAYPPVPGCETALLLLDKTTISPGVSKDTAEARLIARKIHALMDTFPVTENGVSRPLQWGDICILLRSKSTHAAAYVDELNRQGIPAWTAAAGGFFAAREVASAVSLLQLIDNPLQDVPLLSVMLSPAFGFTPDDLAAVRLFRPQGALYTAVNAFADEQENETAHRLAAFLRLLARFRLLAAALPADRLLHLLYEESGLLSMAAAQRHGAQRVANLRLLHEYAHRFEQKGFRGLSAFVRYLEKLRQQESRVSAASAFETGNAVKLITIHNSKGLEFPVVFLAGLGGQFNAESAKGDLLLHMDAGLGLVRRDPDTLRQLNTISKQGVKLAIQNSERAEELRVLYVAMTRAREKLLLVMTTDPYKTLPALAAQVGDEDALPPEQVLGALGMGQWILAAALRHPSGGELRHIAGDDTLCVCLADTPWDIEICAADAAAETTVCAETKVLPDEQLYALLQTRMAYRYPYMPLGQTPAKLAASALSHDFPHGLAKTRPAFASETGLSPTERGTALHTFMQFADFSRAQINIIAEINRLTAGGFLTDEQADSLPPDKIRRFLDSSLYTRLRASPRCAREYSFAIEWGVTKWDPALAALLPEDGAAETMVIQGIADCVFLEEGELVIADYKTDRVRTGEELVARYAAQMRIYAYALSRTWELPVRECLLYSFALGESITVPLVRA